MDETAFGLNVLKIGSRNRFSDESVFHHVVILARHSNGVRLSRFSPISPCSHNIRSELRHHLLRDVNASAVESLRFWFSSVGQGLNYAGLEFIGMYRVPSAAAAWDQPLSTRPSAVKPPRINMTEYSQRAHFAIPAFLLCFALRMLRHDTTAVSSNLSSQRLSAVVPQSNCNGN